MFSHRVRQPPTTPQRQVRYLRWPKETVRHHLNLPRKTRLSIDGRARIQCRWLVNVVEGAKSNVQGSQALVLLAEALGQYVTIRVKEEIGHRGTFPRIQLWLNM